MKNTSKDVFLEKYKQLNPSQKDAVDSVEGPVMVVAGPGTGKTTILTLRIANILLKTDAKPENILALTFTNSGVNAMRKNLIKFIGDEAYRVNIFTFHSFAEYLIKEFSFYFKEFEGSKIINDLDKVHILENILEKNSFKELVSFHDLFLFLGQIKKSIDTIKQEGLTPDEFSKLIPKWEKEMLQDDSIFYKRKFGKFNAGDIKPSEELKIKKQIAKAKEIAQVFEEYQEEIKSKHLHDFSDIILLVLEQLEKNENFKLDLQEQYQYVLVDEHQDTNEGQNKLIELLTDAEHLDGNPNLFTVGDEKQSIYRFQGASQETFDHLQSVYPNIKIINLETNYRSNKTILDSSHELIINSIENAYKLTPFNKQDKKINILEFSNYKFEILYIANDIAKKIEQEKLDPKEIAVIYRSNKHLKEIQNIFNQKNIPHTVLSKENLLEDFDINNLINYIKVVHNPADNYVFGKLLFANFLKIDSHDVLKILNKHRELNKRQNVMTIFAMLENPEILKELELSENNNISEIIKTIKTLKTDSENLEFLTFIKKVLDESNYLSFILKSNNSQDQLLKLDKLFDEIKRQIQNKKQYYVSDFVKFIDAYKKYNLEISSKNPEFLDGVQLMTAHKSKGLEFDTVYIINSSRSNWEKSRGFGSIKLPINEYKGDVDDERRLFYVAMTRAKNNLYISSSLTDWEGKEQDRTQFITELDQDLLEKIDVSEFEKDNFKEFNLFFNNFNLEKSIWNKEYLSSLFLTKTLSVTSLNNYINCPMKYLFRNLIQLPSEYSATLLFGNLIHAALEEFFNQSKIAEKIIQKEKLLEIFNQKVEHSSLYGSELERLLEKGQKLLSDYYDEYSETWTYKIATEKYIKRSFEINKDLSLELSGILDKIEYLDSELEGKINIIDYKTGKTYSDKSTKDQKEDLKRQIIFYHILLENYHDGAYRINQAILDFTEPNKKGEFEQTTFSVSESDIDDVKSEIQKMTTEIISGEFLEKGCHKKDCEFCDFFNKIQE